MILFTQRHVYAKHGKIYLAIEYRREDTGKKKLSIRGPEQNFYQLVVSINKSLSLVKTLAAVYGFYNVLSTVLSTSITT